MDVLGSGSGSRGWSDAAGGCVGDVADAVFGDVAGGSGGVFVVGSGGGGGERGGGCVCGWRRGRRGLRCGSAAAGVRDGDGGVRA